ncbi:hypothetical protein LNQ03_03455 [Klebsiella pneumoniae subsp. pneumoniae]|nr:hypothetical protein [Klebsiella pneumoniae subsp. pneumoniae]
MAQQPQRGAVGRSPSIDMCNLSDALVDEMDRQPRAFIAEAERESGSAGGPEAGKPPPGGAVRC